MDTPTPSSKICLLFLISLLSLSESRCRYNIDAKYDPFYVDTEPFPLGTLEACKDFMEPGQVGCCNQYNDATTASNFKTIDSIFGNAGGGCDLCAINMKRFWCQYACSDRQDAFMDVGKKWELFPDPQDPSSLIPGQRVNVRIHADTACALFNSCKRVPFVASVSAMGTPSGFLNFQGRNAITNGRQYVSMNFSYNLNDSLAFDDSLGVWALGSMSSCAEQVFSPESMVHNFSVGANCTCNTCEQACKGNGFSYKEAGVMEGFSWKLVAGVYGVIGAISIGITLKRKYFTTKLS